MWQKMKSKHCPQPKEFHSLLRSFLFAAQGVWSAFKNERNFRIHLLMVAYLAYFTKYYHFSSVEYAILILVAGLVLSCELLNTAIERAVDLESPSYHALAKMSKDIAAGAVLVSAVCAVGVGILFFWDFPTIQLIAQDVLSRWYIWLILIIISIFLVEYPVYRKKKIQQSEELLQEESVTPPTLPKQ